MYENKGSHPELNHRHCSHAVCVLIFGSPVYSAHVFLNVIFLMLCAPQTNYHQLFHLNCTGVGAEITGARLDPWTNAWLDPTRGNVIQIS